MEIWIEFDQGEWRISPDPARIQRGTCVRWRFKMEDLNARRVRWTIYFSHGHPFAFEGGLGAMSADRLAVSTEVLHLPDGQQVGTSPIMAADKPGDYKYGVRLQDLADGRELGDEDPFLIVF